MRVVVTSGLVLIMLFGGIKDAMVYVYFAFNQDYFAKVKCENLDKPELKCNGKCQLKDMLEFEEANSDNEEPAELGLDFRLEFQVASEGRGLVVSIPEIITNPSRSVITLYNYIISQPDPPPEVG